MSEVTLMPSTENVQRWLLETLEHVCHVEYFLHHLNAGIEDPERPHDITGRYSKFDWDVLKYLARHYECDKPEFFEANVLPGILLHRKQYHHRMWNLPDPNASDDSMRAGASDTICVFLEDRQYAGGRAHRYDEILETVTQNPRNHPRHTHYIKLMLPLMQGLEQPHLEKIASLQEFPNIGLPQPRYEQIIKRLSETLVMLREEHGYELPLSINALP